MKMEVSTPSSSKLDDATESFSQRANGHVDVVKTTPTRVCHMVAQLMHSKLVDFRSATFRHHPNGNVYSIQNPGHSNDKITQLGQEDNSVEQSYDYAIAVVSKRTGKVHYIPTKLVNFQAVYSSDPDSLFGNRQSKQIDYTANNAGAHETWADKRRALTSEFGSAKKLKTQDAAKRRRINDETLAIMMGSTFSSSDVAKKEEDNNPLSISLIAQAESAVLPKANEDAKLPPDVYSPNIFLSDIDISLMKDEALTYFKRPKSEIVGDDCSDLVYDLVGGMGDDAKKASLALLLITMVKCYKVISKSGKSKSYLWQKDWAELRFPDSVTSKVRELFFRGEFIKESARSRSAKLNVNLAERDKLLAHLLCLAIILNKESFSLPITPWAKELNVTEVRITKVLTALGCSVQSASVSDGLRLGTLRIAHLTGPPPKNTGNKKFMRRR